ncbi:MFS transporter [Brevibacterium litoralis]|uniref:MFS transporter n=1 Tax=Brevibacterium litoralis TaxID=3138935 RepID=UPI0032EEC4E3
MSFRSLFADTRPLRVPTFRRLWTANIVTVIGAQMSVIAVPAQIYSITHSSAYVGLTGLFGLVPLIVFGLYGGALSDLFDRRKILVLTTLGLVVTTAGFWVLAAVDTRNVWALLWTYAAQQAFFALNQPARGAVIPLLVPADQLPSANALNMMVMSVGAIIGPVFGGALIPLFGYEMLYAIDTLCLVATLWAVWTLPSMRPTRSGTGRRRVGMSMVLDGFRYVATNPVVLMSFVVDVIAMVFGMPRALFPEIADVTYGGPPEGGVVFSLLFASIAAGSALGGLFSGWVSRIRRQGLAVVWLVVAWGVAMTGFGLMLPVAGYSWILSLGFGLAFLAFGGAMDVFSGAFRSAILQEAAPDDMRGRLQGVFIVVVAGGPRVADLLHGWAAEATSPAIATAGGGSPRRDPHPRRGRGGPGLRPVRARAGAGGHLSPEPGGRLGGEGA